MNKLLIPFQSSSCWRMAESFTLRHGLIFFSNGFNPHHAGEWLKAAVTAVTVNKKIVSILIMLANG